MREGLVQILPPAPAQPVDADGDPQRALRGRRHRRAAVLLPALVRAGLQGLHLVHVAAQQRDGRVRDGQEVDVEVLLSRRPERDRTRRCETIARIPVAMSWNRAKRDSDG